MKLRANPTDKSESSLKDCERLGLVRTSAEYAEEVRFDDVLALRDAYRGMVHAVQKVNAITAIRMDQVSPIQSTSPEPTGSEHIITYGCSPINYPVNRPSSLREGGSHENENMQYI